MESEALKIAAQYGIPAAIAVYLVWNLNANFKALLERLLKIIEQNNGVIQANTETMNDLKQETRDGFREIKGHIANLHVDAKCKAAVGKE